MTTGPVLVTGAFGFVGSAVVGHLVGAGRRVVATDLDLPRNRRKARGLDAAAGVEVRWADLTDPAAVDDLVTTVAPGVIVHLAALIPPVCYAHRDLARRVNVDATRSLVRAASGLASPPRFLLASSVAVYGSRNPHRGREPLTAATPVDPCDLYGSHKVEAERAVTASGLDWVVLRLGGVLTPTPQGDAGLDMLRFEGVLPVDGRIHTVDVRDVARAFDAAASTPATGEVFVIGGDDSHRVVQGTLGRALAEAFGLVNAFPAGRPGDPDSDRHWFATDWIDTARAQEVLAFQHHSLADVIAAAKEEAGWRRWPLRVVAPALRTYLRLRSPYRHAPGRYADPWGAIGRTWGDPSP